MGMEQKEFKIKGFLFSGISAGIKKDGKRDLGLIYSEVPARVAGLFTTNKIQAAPVILDRERIRKGLCQAVIINSGNANACTGKRGLRDAKRICSLVAKHLGIDEDLVLISSTGVIGVPLPMDKIEREIPKLVEGLSPDGWDKTVESIMTTDTFPKYRASNFTIKDKEVRLFGMVKGAGMIRPDLATMLSFLVTDANIESYTLKNMLKKAVETSFNRITIDGETSTNDTVLLIANGKSNHPVINKIDKEAKIFQSKLSDLCEELAKSIVMDGEGATKFIEIIVRGAKTRDDAKKIAYTIANSPLVKTAFYGEDVNWGRILAAIGHSGVRVDPEKIDLFFDKIPLVRKGVGILSNESKASESLRNRSLKVVVNLNLGKEEFSVYTTDLSIDYVKVNASYRS